MSSKIFAQIDLFNARDLSSIKIEDISDQELKSVFQKGVDAGYTQSEMLTILQEKGLPQSELRVLKDRLNFINQDLQKNTTSRPKAKNNLPERKFDESEVKLPMSKADFDSTIFGSNLFSSASMTFEPNLRIPAPANYVLGPDDEVIISVYGYSENRYQLTVDEQGEIYIPNVGPLLLSGITLEEAQEKIRNRLASTIYTAIRSGQTKVQVTLGKIKSIRVTVIGEAKKPGTYTVSSLTTLYNVLYLCGGPTDLGSYRQIEIIRGNEKRMADLYDFLVYGTQKGNVLLKEGDVVRIPYYQNRVVIGGLVKRTGKYEMLETETFQNLLSYSGGFMDNAYRGEVSVQRITDSARKIVDLKAADFSSFIVKGSDRYFVKSLQDEFVNRLYISGSVHRPGPYELTPKLRLRQLIERAGGLTPDAYTQRAIIYRYLPNKLPVIQSVNLDSLFSGLSEFNLHNNDSIVINSIFSFRDLETIAIKGNVRKTQEIPWRSGLTLKDALFSSGGIADAGDSSNIEVSRRISNVQATEKNYKERESFIINLKDSESSDLALEPYDIIIVKEKPGYSAPRTVTLTGEIIGQGTYILENIGTKITDVLNRAGGFKASADSSFMKIRRLKENSIIDKETQQILQRAIDKNKDSVAKNVWVQSEISDQYDLISVDLKYIIANPASPENLLLEDGDILSIERASNLVKVSGEVYFPTIVAYKPDKNLKYYVQQAGNFMPSARKSGALVVYPNGNVSSVKRFLFFKTYPVVAPRAEIFVPEKEKGNRKKLGATEWAVIVSALGILSNVVINISK